MKRRRPHSPLAREDVPSASARLRVEIMKEIIGRDLGF
jgi:hypothetical protein